MDMLKTCRKKNKYGLSKFVYFLILLTVVGIISLMIVSSKLNLVVSQNTKYAILILVISEAFIIYAFVLGLKLTLLGKNKAITIDSNSKTPDFDDELMLKKKLDELNRKLEIKKVQDKIDEVQKELDGEN